MKQQLGFLMQLFVLVMLPVLIVFQLQFGFRLIVMPVSLVAGIVLFSIGARLREPWPPMPFEFRERRGAEDVFAGIAVKNWLTGREKPPVLFRAQIDITPKCCRQIVDHRNCCWY